jgi:hypothetical protein
LSDELTAFEELVTKFLLDLMTERVMSERGVSIGVQAYSMRGLSASPSTTHGTGPSRERKTKHKDDLENAKLILSILPAYLPPLSGAINWDSVPRDFEYVLVIVFLPKEVHVVRANQDKLEVLNFSYFNLDDRKVYNMLTPHKYLTRTKGNNSKITPQSWT